MKLACRENGKKELGKWREKEGKIINDCMDYGWISEKDSKKKKICYVSQETGLEWMSQNNLNWYDLNRSIVKF